jgi:hypothetical protein
MWLNFSSLYLHVPVSYSTSPYSVWKAVFILLIANLKAIQKTPSLLVTCFMWDFVVGQLVTCRVKLLTTGQLTNWWTDNNIEI